MSAGDASGPTLAVPTRRTCLAAMAGLLFAPLARPAPTPLLQLFGKAPSRIERVFAAGPPAAVLITALAPERPLGWPMTMSDRARALLPAPARDQPLLGRLAGRGSPVSVESLLALQPHLVLDAGTVDGIYSSAAQRVIPHGLKPRACASIALSRARRCGPSSAGPTTGHRTGSHRQLQGDEFRAANVGSGSKAGGQRLGLTALKQPLSTAAAR